MSRRLKYDGLTRYLAAQRGEYTRLTLADLEAIIEGPLPPGARSPRWWGNSATAPQSRAWRRTGWRAARTTGPGPVTAVTFVREPGDAAGRRTV
jgi:hypothetical protein